MNVEDVELLDESNFDISIVKTDLDKVHHQQNDQVYEADKNIEFILGETTIHYQRGNSHLQFDIVLKKHGDDLDDDNSDVIRLVNNTFFHVFKEAYIQTTGSTKIEGNKFVGQVSTIMRLLTSKKGDLSSNFDEINRNKFNNTSLKEILNKNNTIHANEGRVFGQHIIPKNVRYSISSTGCTLLSLNFIVVKYEKNFFYEVDTLLTEM